MTKDIISSVMNIASNASSVQARNKLAAIANGRKTANIKFAPKLDSLDSNVRPKGEAGDLLLQVMQKAEPTRVAAITGKLSNLSMAGDLPAGMESADSTQRLEASILTHLYGEMMPDQKSGLYGSGSSGQIWQQMLTERIAEATAERSPLNLADKLTSSSEGKNVSRVRTVLHWPYFSNYEVKSYVG